MARSMTRDLTEGRPLKLIVSFALPLLFGVLFQQLYSFVDTAIVGDRFRELPGDRVMPGPVLRFLDSDRAGVRREG